MKNQTLSVRAQDQLLDDEVRQSPVDVEQQEIHRKLLRVAVPCSWLLAPSWMLALLLLDRTRR